MNVLKINYLLFVDSKKHFVSVKNRPLEFLLKFCMEYHVFNNCYLNILY